MVSLNHEFILRMNKHTLWYLGKDFYSSSFPNNTTLVSEIIVPSASRNKHRSLRLRLGPGRWSRRKGALDRCCHRDDRRSPVQRPAGPPTRTCSLPRIPWCIRAARQCEARAGPSGPERSWWCAHRASSPEGGNLKCAALQDKELSTNTPSVTGNQRGG